MQDFLKRFCAAPGSDLRKWLTEPFSHEGFTYATNGHILVRVPLIEGFPAATAGNPKLGEHVVGIMKRFDGAVFVKPESVSLPDIEESSKEVECDSCEGRGTDHDCPSCTCECDDCGGSGKETKVDTVSTDFCGCTFRLKYVGQVLALPGVEIAPTSPNSKTQLPLLFRFDGGAGVLMPTTRQLYRHVKIESVAA